MDNQGFSMDEEYAASPALSSSRQSRSSASTSISSSSQNLKKCPINICRNVLYADNLYKTYHRTDANKNLVNSDSGNDTESASSINNKSKTRPSALRQLLCGRQNPNRPKPPFSIIRFLQKKIPILHWLPNYSIRNNLSYDLVAGITVFALNIPQGLSYGRLAGVEPIIGLYVSLFPVIIYAMMGTSRHISIGTFAIISIACRDALENIGFDPNYSRNVNSFLDLSNNTIQLMSRSNGTDTPDLPANLEPIEALTVLCLLVGIIQFVLGTLKLGVLAILLSDTLISAFVVGSAIHVFTSQVYTLIGLKSAIAYDFIHSIPFELVRIYINLVLKLVQVNWTTILLSALTISSLVLFKHFMEPLLQRRFKLLRSIAIPIDIVVIIIVIVISDYLNLKENYHVEVIPKIPVGFKGLPVVPPLRWNLIMDLFGSAILVSFIAYVSSLSLAKMYAKKHGNYWVSPNQELLAMGTANIFSSFFLCYPCSASLSRSSVQERVGCKTQLTTIFSSILLVLFLLFFSTYLETLPQCVLASMIVVALISSLRKFSEFFEIWKISKSEGAIWLVTFVLVLLFGVGQGLFYSVAASLAILLIRLSFPSFRLKEPVPDSEVYLESSSATAAHILEYSKCRMSTSVIIFDFQGPLMFINTNLFKYKFDRCIGDKLTPIVCNDFFSTNLNMTQSDSAGKQSTAVNRISSVIFDCSHLSYVDQKGVEMLTELNHDLQTQYNVQLLLASPCSTVYTMLNQCKYFDHFDRSKCLATVHDAYVVATSTDTIKS